MNIVVLDGYAANPGDLCWDELQALGECTIYDRTAPAEVLERAAGAEILLTNKTVLTAEHMAALPELKYIGVLATGYNIVDTAAAKERGIIVTNIPAYSTDSVAQMVFAHILNITQQVQHHSEEVHRGRWTASKDFCFWDTPLIELREKKLGIVGLGHTGFTTARIAIGFGMEVHAYTSKTNFQLPPEIRKMELDELFRERLILREEGSGTRNILERELAQQGYGPSAFADFAVVSSFKLITELTAEGFGVSFLYAAVVGDDPRFGRFSCPPLTGAHELNAVFLKHTDAGALARRFLGRMEG